MTPAQFVDAFVDVPLPLALADHHCVYAHTFNGQTIFIGTCELLDLYKITDAKRNSVWHERLCSKTPPHDPVMISVLHCVASAPDAAALAAYEIAMRKPVCNLEGTQRHGNGRASRIECSNGKVYGSIAEAAAALNIPPPSISNHLNKRYGYASVHNLHFRRVP